MKKFFSRAILTGLVVALWGAALVAQVDPRDSIILESKAVPVGQDTGPTSDTSAYVYLKVEITNKDSLTALNVALKETSISNGAYLLLAWPRTFNGVVSMLTSTLNGSRVFSGGFYHGNSPDSFLVAGVYDPLDLSTAEPPNLVRKAFYEIKFDSAIATANGTVEFDSARVIQPSGFVNTVPADIQVNFVKSIVTITATDVRDINPGQRPQAYSLSQNYPNPFNANTQISFALPQSGKTKLEVFNILGQKVNTLVDEYMTAGFKIVNWDGRDNRGMEVPSGIYFYRLRSEKFLQTKKMLMIQ